MDLTGLISFFADLAFPIAVAAYLLVVTSRELERIRTNQIKMLVLQALLLDAFGVSIPDTELCEIVEGVKARRERKEKL